MNEHFGPDQTAVLPDSDRRRPAAEEALTAGPPSIETEEWRYSPIGELDASSLVPVLERPGPGSVIVDRFDEAVERAATVVMVDGWVVEVDLDPGWGAKGLVVETAQRAAAIDADSETTVYDLLHRAFSPEALVISAPDGLTVDAPVVIVNHQATVGVAAFPHIVVAGGEASDLRIVERQTSVVGTGLGVPVTEIDVAPAARVRYQTLQELDRAQWQLARQRTTVAQQATLDVGIGAFGAHYARVRTDGRLTGRGASSNLVAAYYGDGDQVHDFRTFQHHDAADGRSDLLFKGAQDAASGSVYTGLIHIHPEGSGTNAFQTNRNIKLSPDAWAWSVPNLEIENNDVHCSHASTVSPLDEDQQFYLASRGVPPVTADRLIVAGFFDDVIRRLPSPEVHAAVRRHVAAKLDARTAS